MVFGVSNTSYPTSTERMRIDSSGNVGVGTTSPSEKLHVVGSILADSGASSNHSKLLGNAAEILIGRTTTNGIKVFAGSSNQKQIQVLGDFPLDYYINGTFHTRFDSNGNVGIGTDAPSHKLTVPSGTNGRVARLGNLEITTQAATYSGSSIEVTGFNSFIKYNSTLGHKFFTRVQGGGNTLEALTIVPDTGNVGIGTTSPRAKLHVDNGSNGTTAITNSSTDYSFYTDAVQTNTYQGLLGTGENSTVTAAIHSFDDGISAAQGLIFSTGNNTSLNESIRIKANGNVGIGTTSPSQKLTVEGNI